MKCNLAWKKNRKSHPVVVGSTFENAFGANWPWVGAAKGYGRVAAENIGFQALQNNFKKLLQGVGGMIICLSLRGTNNES